MFEELREEVFHANLKLVEYGLVINGSDRKSVV